MTKEEGQQRSKSAEIIRRNKRLKQMRAQYHRLNRLGGGCSGMKNMWKNNCVASIETQLNKIEKLGA